MRKKSSLSQQLWFECLIHAGAGAGALLLAPKNEVSCTMFRICPGSSADHASWMWAGIALALSLVVFSILAFRRARLAGVPLWSWSAWRAPYWRLTWASISLALVLMVGTPVYYLSVSA